MRVEQTKADPSNFAHVLYLAVAAILVIVVAALVIVSWRAHQKNKTPYTKHPVSLLNEPVSTLRAV